MRLLLDTHAFIWWDSDPARLTSQALAICRDPANSLIVSVASIWEIQIKEQLGKLQLAAPLPNIISQQQANGMEVIPIHLEHVLELERLPIYHKDPFDRILIAQARIENATVLTHDSVFAQYSARVLW